MMKRKLIFILLSVFCFNATAQDYWKSYRDTDGLITKVAKSLVVENGVVYVATAEGLSVLENEIFKNYDTSNSTLPSQNIKLIKNFNDTVWMATDSGLTQFFKGQMKHFSDTNGLLTRIIQDMEVDSKGNLWIASFDGLTKKSGTVFTHETGKKIFNIGINEGDSIYANVNFSSIVNVASPVTVELFDGQSWSVLRDTSLDAFINTANLVQLNSKEIGILSKNNAAYTIDSLFSINKIEFPDSTVNTINLTDMVKDSAGDFWFSFGDLSVTRNIIGGLYRYNGSEFEHFYTGLPANKVYDIELEGNTIYIATDNGIAFADISVRAIPRYEFLETSSIKFPINSDGTIFRAYYYPASSTNFYQKGLVFPKETKKGLIYSSGLWLSEDSEFDERKIAIQRYDAGDFSPGTINSNGNLVSSSMIKISKSEIDFHLENHMKLNYIMPESIKNWPGNGKSDLNESPDQAPFVDVNGNYCYDPENGDYPFIIGDHAVYLVINDAYSPTTGQADPNLNIEVQVLAYVFDQPDVDFIDKTGFVRYTIINRSSKKLEKFNTGIYYDFDVGNALDDFVGSDPGSNLFYAYNGDLTDESSSNSLGYNSLIPSIGVKIINEDLSGFIGYDGYGTSRNSNPFTVGHYYRSLNSLWNDSLPITQFGDGYNPTLSNKTNFLFNGDVTNSNQWSALNPGPNAPANLPSELGAVGIVSPFSLDIGERKIIDIAVGVGFDSANTNYLDNIDLMINNLNSAANYQKGLLSILPQHINASCVVGLEEISQDKKKGKLSIYPNPTNGELNVLALEGIKLISVFDLLGKLIQEAVLSKGSNLGVINLNEQIPNGIYLIQARTISNQILSEKLILNR